MAYYTGDYYTGDNYGAFQAGGLFKTLGKIAGGVVRGVVNASPIGGVVRAVSGVVRGVNALVDPSRETRGAAVSSAGGMSTLIPTFGLGGGGSGRRRMNPLNIKALRRAMRRAKGFERQARRVGSFFNPGKTFRLKGRARKRR